MGRTLLGEREVTKRGGFTLRGTGMAVIGALTLAACTPSSMDWDLRPSDRFTTSDAARSATGDRPSPDARGVISYPGFQVAVARRGDTVSTVAERVGISAGELARYNALTATDALRDGEVLALPRRVAEPEPFAGGRPAGGGIDVTAIASTAIDRADGQGTAGGTRVAAASPPAGTPTPAGTRAPARSAEGAQPVRHQVVRGETAFSIARLYNVSTRALAEWNGLGPDMMVREGQYLLIPLPAAAPLRCWPPSRKPRKQHRKNPKAWRNYVLAVLPTAVRLKI